MSIVVSPRERFSSVVRTVEELKETVPESTEIVVVEGGAPVSVKRFLARAARAGTVRWIRQPKAVLPNVARNIGVAETNSEFVVFVDNDIVFEGGWLEALVERADSSEADVVAPLICIGPPRAMKIHHAGGTLQAEESSEGVRLREIHRQMNVPLSDFDPESAPVENEVAEFHCFLVRRSFLEKMGPLDERLITREQMDFALRCRALGGRIVFENKSVVSYLAEERFSISDLRYHLFRWADCLAVSSMDAFEESWGVSLERERIRFGWIANHRGRAGRSALAWVPGWLTSLLQETLVRVLEGLAERDARRLIALLREPLPLTADDVERTIRSIPRTAS